MYVTPHRMSKQSLNLYRRAARPDSALLVVGSPDKTTGSDNIHWIFLLLILLLLFLLLFLPTPTCTSYSSYLNKSRMLTPGISLPPPPPPSQGSSGGNSPPPSTWHTTPDYAPSHCLLLLLYSYSCSPQSLAYLVLRRSIQRLYSLDVVSVQFKVRPEGSSRPPCPPHL